MARPNPTLDEASTSRVIEMAWCDRTPFAAITAQFVLTEAEVIALMRRELKASSYRLWRKRVQGRKAKHAGLGAAVGGQRALNKKSSQPGITAGES